jgi:hypothetical protein
VRHDVKENTETATRKDAQPVEKVNSTQQSRPKIVKAVVLKKTNSTVPQGNISVAEDTKDVTGARRDRISKILSKLVSEIFQFQNPR